MPALFDWEIELFDSISGSDIGTVTEATNLEHIEYLNGIDEIGFSLHLDNAMAPNITEGKTGIRMWRTVSDTEKGKTRTPDPTRPDFVGTVGSVVKQGKADLLTCRAFSPFWHLQFRFHLLNHRLWKDNIHDELFPGGVNPNMGDYWAISRLMFKIISYVQRAFVVDEATSFSYLGINIGTWPSYASELKVTNANYAHFLAQGSYAWSNIYDQLLSMEGAPDLVPEYVKDATHVRRKMLFSTANPRGENKSSSGMTPVYFDYNTGNSNLEDVEESSGLTAGTFGNYGWAIGRGKNSNKIAVAYDTTGDFSLGTIGNFMTQWDFSSVTSRTQLVELANSEIKKSARPPKALRVQLAPLLPPYPQTDFNLGDLIQVRADKGALSVDRAQRIYQITKRLTDNRNEVVECLVADDFRSKVPTE